MEYARRDRRGFSPTERVTVLILVLMEYARRASNIMSRLTMAMSLNPCFNGICAPRTSEEADEQYCDSLNPCFNGICAPRARLLKSLYISHLTENLYTF